MSFFFIKWFMKRRNKFLGGLTEWDEQALYNSFNFSLRENSRQYRLLTAFPKT
jgi:hypothetical protein